MRRSPADELEDVAEKRTGAAGEKYDCLRNHQTVAAATLENPDRFPPGN
jgi:hypothetical protein